MSMKRHIELLQARAIKTLQVIQPAKEAKEFPCPCCGGAATICAVIQYYRNDENVTTVTNSSGVPITARDINVCPACAGSGVDVALMHRHIEYHLKQQNQGVA